MLNPWSHSEQLLFSTVRIVTPRPDGAVGYGTGFFFNYMIDERHVLQVLVTNKHVIKDEKTGILLDRGVLTLHVAEGVGDKQRPTDKMCTVSIAKFGESFIQHPDNSVDLCAMSLAFVFEGAKAQGASIFHRSLSNDFIPSDEVLDELDAVEDILMFGYPDGLWDEVNNMPLIRRGITSSHPTVNFNGKPETAVDIACFRGSSGSPVLIVDGSFSADKRGNVSMNKRRVYFLGVLYAGPQVTAEGEIVVRTVPTVSVPVAVTPMMMHLGYIIKAKEVLTLCRHMLAQP